METPRALTHRLAASLRRASALILLALTACSPALRLAPTPPGDSPTPGESATPRAPGPSPSPPLTPSATFTPSATATATASPSPPTAVPTPTPLPCLAQGGTIARHTLRTPISPLPWEFRVYTPPCYLEWPERRFPLLILIHGSTYTDDQWDRLGADETADALIASGELPPFLILMPRDRVWTDAPDDDPFGQALIEYILPWVDENYRTQPERASRAIGGLSRGASWAVHLGLAHWELFGAVGAHSLPVFVTDPPRLERWLSEIPPDSMPRFFLDIGENDHLLPHALWFTNLLTARNIPHEWHLFTGRHEEAYWQAHLEQYLRWYAQTWLHSQ